MNLEIKQTDCVICLEKSSIVLVEQEQDLCKGVQENFPSYYKFCLNCRKDYFDNETYEINQRIKSQK